MLTTTVQPGPISIPVVPMVTHEGFFFQIQSRSALKMDGPVSSDMLITMHNNTWRHITGEGKLNIDRHGNL